MTAPTNRVRSRSRSCSSSCARPCTFFRVHALEWMLFLTVVTCLAICRTLSYAMSGSTVPAIEHLDCRSFFLTVGRCYPEKWLGLLLSDSMYRWSLSSSFICLSVSSADRTTSSAFSSVSSCTLSNLSLVLVLFTPSTIRSLIIESSSVFQIHMFHLGFSIQLTYWSIVSPLSWALEKNLNLS